MAMTRTGWLMVVAVVLAFPLANTLATAPAPVPVAPAPAPAATADKWEYGEIQSGRTPARAAVAGQPAQPARTNIRWVTSDDEVEAQDWEDLATKLKAPAAKMNVSPNTHKLRLLNHLGADGWELVGHEKGDTIRAPESWTFKRKVKK